MAYSKARRLAQLLGTDGSITAGKIPADAIDGTKIADNAINSEHYADGSIDTAHIAGDQISGSLIPDNAIDSEHYTDGSIDTAHIAADQITSALIADDQINSEHIVDGSIDLAHMSVNSIDSDQYVDGSIDTVHIGDDQITAAKIANAINTDIATGVTANTTANAALPKAGGAMTGAITTNSTFDGVDIATRDALLTSTISDVALKATIANPTLTGTPAAPTASGSTSTTQLATTAFVQQELTTLIGGAPSTLNDLNELAAAINDDANYNSTLTTALATKLPLAGGAMTGAITTNSTFDGVDIAVRDAILTSTTTTANAALPKAGGTLTGALTLSNSLTVNPSSAVGMVFDDDGTNGYMNWRVNSVDDTIQLYAGRDQSMGYFAIGAKNSSGTLATRFKIWGSGLAEFTGNQTVGGTLGVGAGSASAPSLSFAGDTNTGLFRGAADQLNFAIGGQDKAFFSTNQLNVSAKIVATELDINGNADISGTLGVTGATTLGGTLTVNTDADSQFIIGDGGTNAITLYGGSGDELYMGANATWKLRFQTDGNITMDNGGNFGIGTSSPLNPLHIQFDSGTTYSGTSDQGGGIYLNNIYHEALNTFSQLRLGVSGASGASYVRLVAIEPGQAQSDFAITLRNSSTYFERLRIKGLTGNIGIGTDAPAAKLTISGNSDTSDEDVQLRIIDLDGSSGSKIPSIGFYGGSTQNARIRGTDSQGMVISSTAANADDLVVQLGKIGVGTNSPATAIHSHSAAGSPELRLTTGQNSGTPTAQIGYAAGSGYFLRLGDAANNEDIMLRTYGDSYFRHGPLHIGTTDSISSSSELLSVYSASTGNTKLRNSSDSYVPLYIENASTTANTFQPFITMQSGGGNRGYVGVRYTDSVAGFSGQGGISLRTGAASLDGSTERMRISSTGNVGIGVSAPDSYPAGATTGSLSLPLEEIGMRLIFKAASGNGHAGISTIDQSGAGLMIGANTYVNSSGAVTYGRSDHPSSGIYFDGWSGDRMRFYTGASGNPTERMTILADGKIGINEPVPIRKLTVNHGGGTDGLLLHADVDTANGPNGLYFKNDSTNNDRRIKGAVLFVRDDPGTRGTGSLHLCVEGVNSDTNVAVNHSRLSISPDGNVLIPYGLQMRGKMDGGPTSSGAYHGADGSNFGYSGIFKTDTIAGSSSAAATSQFLSVYSSGHWGEYPMCRLTYYGTYYQATYRQYLFRMTGSTIQLVEVHAHGTTTSFGPNVGGITASSAVLVGSGTHSGQSVYRCDLTYNTGSTYQRGHVVVEIGYGGGGKTYWFGSNNTQAEVDSHQQSYGGAYHFKTLSQGAMRGQYTDL